MEESCFLQVIGLGNCSLHAHKKYLRSPSRWHLICCFWLTGTFKMACEPSAEHMTFAQLPPPSHPKVDMTNLRKVVCFACSSDSLVPMADRSGGSVVRMVNGVLGKELFRKGLGLYMRRFAYRAPAHFTDLSTWAWLTVEEGSQKNGGRSSMVQRCRIWNR